MVSDDKLEEQYEIRNNYFDVYTRNLADARSLLLDHESDVQSQRLDIHSYNKNTNAQIKLPKFDGKIDSFFEFKNTFESLINQNNSIASIQKFHYLKASLCGDALKIIQAIDFTAENYSLAWSLICERFNNKRLLNQNHLKAIFEAEIIIKESAKSLRGLIDTVFKHLRILKTLGQPIKEWDSIIIYIVTSKLDKVTLREWEKGNSGNSPTLVS